MKIILTEFQLFELGLLEDNSRGCDIFTDFTSVEEYDDIISKNPGRFLRTMKGKIVQMSVREFFDRVSQIHGVPVPEIFNKLDKKKIATLSQLIDRRVKLDLPYINYNSGSEDGKHRVAAAIVSGCDMVKIAVFYKDDQASSYRKGSSPLHESSGDDQ